MGGYSSWTQILAQDDNLITASPNHDLVVQCLNGEIRILDLNVVAFDFFDEALPG
jgi:hypothetical protein